jgi:integrase
MGRRRKHDRHLPQRVYCRRGKYYFVHPDERWEPLGDDFAHAMAVYGRLTSNAWTASNMADVIARYRREVLPLKAPKTRKNDGALLGRLAATFGQMSPCHLMREDVEEYLERRATTPTAARHELALLSHVFTKAIRWRIARTNPCIGIERPTSKPRDRYVADEELNALYATAPESIQIAIDLALLTGQRQADILALTRDDVTDDGIQFTQGKTGRKVLVEWSDALRAVIARARSLPPQLPGKFIVRTVHGKGFTGNGFRSNWQHLMQRVWPDPAERARCRFRFHDLRAKSASDTRDLHEAAARLGHADPKITKRVYRRGFERVKPLR